MARAKKQKMPLAPKITFVGGKWYNELRQEVPKPQPKPLPGAVPVAGQPLQRYDELDALRRAEAVVAQETEDELFERLAMCTCASPQFTGHVPGCVHFADALYVCEGANRETIAQLAKLSEGTISGLERRRIEFGQLKPQGRGEDNGPYSNCPERIPQNDGRRRCWQCPYWDRHLDETPFDHQKGGAE